MNKINTPRVLTSLGVTGFAAIMTAAIWNRPSDVQILMLALLTMTALGAVSHPHWLVSLCTLGAALALYCLVWMMSGSSPSKFSVEQGALGICLLVVTALGAWSLSRGLRSTERHLVRQAQLIEDLTVYDQNTGAVRAAHTQQIPNYEIMRARRYNEALSLAVIEIVDEKGRSRKPGKSAAEANADKEMRKRVTELFLSKLRAVDRVGYTPSMEWVVLLPNTPRAGAETLAVRLIHMVAEQLGVNIVVGLASFPEDGSDTEGLVSEARAALEFGRMNAVSMVSQTLFDNT
jgi:GGDEF domain-containing protein